MSNYYYESELKTKKLTLTNKIFHKVDRRHYKRGSIIRHNVHSNFLNNNRDIDIYLPPTYHLNKNKRYPVLYMHDGNNLFYPSLSFGGVAWEVDKTVDKLVNNGVIEEIIVVGIHNTMSRDYEYTWTPMKEGRHLSGGGGEKYARFIIQELKPLIDSHFRTLPDRNNTAVMGSSLGGLISFYLGLYAGSIFGKIGVVSPSFWWGQGIAYKHVLEIKNNLQIWLDMGAKETYSRTRKNDYNIHLVQTMKKYLIAKGYKEGYNMAYLEDKAGKHNEHSWARRVHLPLIFFFGKNKNILFTKRT